MADKKITDLQLRSAIVDTVNIPVDDGVQSYRVTAPQVFDYLRAKYSTVRTVTAATTLTAADVIVLLNPTVSFTQPLPAAAGLGAGVIFDLKNIHATNTVTIDPNSSELIDGAQTIVMEPGDALRVFNTGTAWLILPSFMVARRAKIEAAERIPTGGIFPFAGSTAPTGYLLCDGSAISRTTYAALYAVIGVTHGYGDNSTTFNLPDYRGRFLRGRANGSGNDPDRASRTAMATGGSTGDNVGTVQAAAYALHNHSVTDPTHQHNNYYNASVNLAGGGSVHVMTGTNVSGTQNFVHAASTGITIQNSGGNETRPINAYVNYLIKY